MNKLNFIFFEWKVIKGHLLYNKVNWEKYRS